MFRELFMTYTGLLSLGVIVFMLGMFVYIYRFFLRHESEELKK